MLSRTSIPLALVLAVALPAQTPPHVFPAPPNLLAGFELRAGTVQNLALPATNGTAFDVTVVLGAVPCTLTLAPHDVRAADFKLLLDDGVALRQLPTPASVTYRGHVRGLAGSDVAASLIAGQLAATIHLEGGTLWSVQPLTAVDPALPRESHVVYRDRDVVRPDVHCGVAAHAHDVEPGHGGPAPAAIKIAEIAIDADRAYYARNGSNTTTVNNQVTSVMNGVGVIFRRDVEIDYLITAILIRTTAIYAWNGDLCNLLSQFGNYWAANHGSIRRDLAHLFTGEGSFSGVIGCAYLGVVCTSSSYGSSKAYSTNLTTNVGLVAHEIGHNWNAPHCNSVSPCNIMCSGLGGCSGNISSFEAYSVGIIVAFKNSRTCLSDPAPPILTLLNPNATTSYQPAQITATGQRLDGTTSVTVGGRSVSFTPVNATTLRFTPPSPMTIGAQPVIASNGAGGSSPLTLTISGNHPSVVVATPLLLRNFANRIDLYSDAGWVGLLLFSTSNAPSSLPGFVDLGIGNAFAQLIQFGFVSCGPDGAGGLAFSPPANTPVGLTLYWQALTLNPQNVTLPFEVSNVRQTQIL